MSKISLSWSGGKDSMLALHKIKMEGKYKVDHLHTVIDADLKRVGLHGISERLIDEQAASLGMPLEKLYLSASEGYQNYEKLIASYFEDLENEDFDGVVYGDIFLEDLKQYREKMLHHAGLQGIFPLWGLPTSDLIIEFIELGYQTKVCAANAQFFSKEHLGQTITHDFIENLPDEVDPCGENGEFHTFVYNGPLFSYPLEIKTGEIVAQDYSYSTKKDDGSIEQQNSTFLFADLLIK